MQQQQLMRPAGGAAPALLAPVSRRAPLSLSARRRQHERHIGAADAYARQHERHQRRIVIASASPIETDAATRVAGTPAAVADYLSRVEETWPSWYPRLVSARRTDGGKIGSSAPPPVGATFEVVVRAAGGGGGLIPAIDLAVTVQLLERSSKRVAFAASSPFHSVREQYLLMPCPAGDGRQTTIRHVSEVRLKGAWAGALAAPVVGGIMRAAPKEALERLEAALRTEEQRRRGKQQGRAGKAGTAGAGAGNGNGSSGSGSPFWKGLFGGGGGNNGRSSPSSPPSPPTTNIDDPYGLYAALGLTAAAAAEAAGDQGPDAADALIKAAYRQRAKLLHPDANVGADRADVERLEVEFARVQRAYVVLRDSEARRRYDRGDWRPDEGEGEEGDGRGGQ